MASRKATPKVSEARVAKSRKSSSGILSQDEIDALLSCTEDDDQVEESESDKPIPGVGTSEVTESIKCFICGDDAFRIVRLKVDSNLVPALVSYCGQFSIVLGDVENLMIQAYNAGLKSKTS